MTRLVRLAVSLVLTLTFPATTYGADAGAKADEMVSTSHKIARKLAEDLFRMYLMVGLTENSQQNETVQRITSALTEAQAEIATFRDKTSDLALSIQNASAIASEESFSQAKFREALDKSVSAYDGALLNLRMNHLMVNKGEVTTKAVQEAIKRILAHTKESCRLGVSAQFSAPNLPPVVLRPPGFEFGFTFRTTDSTVPGGNDMSITPYASTTLVDLFGGSDHDKQQMAALLGTGIYLGGYYLAVYGLGYTAGSTAAFVAAGVFAVVVYVAIFVIMDWQVRERAKEQADAVEKVFSLRANPQDVAGYYRQICQNEGKILLDIPTEGPLPPPDELETQYVEAALTRLAELERQVAKDPAGPAQDTPAGKALRDYIINEIGLSGLARIVRHQLLTLANQSGKAETMIKGIRESEFAKDRQIELENQISRARERLIKLNDISYRQSLESQAVAALQAEIQSDQKVATLYGKWQHYYAIYLEATFNGADTVAALRSLRELQKEVLEALKARETPALRAMAQRSSLFLAGIR